jgi:hypothetical protein
VTWLPCSTALALVFITHAINVVCCTTALTSFGPHKHHVLGCIDAFPQLLVKLALAQVVHIQENVDAHFLKAHLEKLRKVAAADTPVAAHARLEQCKHSHIIACVCIPYEHIASALQMRLIDENTACILCKKLLQLLNRHHNRLTMPPAISINA